MSDSKVTALHEKVMRKLAEKNKGQAAGKKRYAHGEDLQVDPRSILRLKAKMEATTSTTLSTQSVPPQGGTRAHAQPAKRRLQHESIQVSKKVKELRTQPVSQQQLNVSPHSAGSRATRVATPTTGTNTEAITAAKSSNKVAASSRARPISLSRPFEVYKPTASKANEIVKGQESLETKEKQRLLAQERRDFRLADQARRLEMLEKTPTQAANNRISSMESSNSSRTPAFGTLSRLALDVIKSGVYPFPQANAPNLSAIPSRFDHTRHYLNTFHPLLVEECRESIRQGVQECVNFYSVSVSTVSDSKDQKCFKDITLKVSGLTKVFRENDIVVLTGGDYAAGTWSESTTMPSKIPNLSQSNTIVGFIPRSGGKGEITLRTTCTSDLGQYALRQLRRSSSVHAAHVGSLVTVRREYEALHNIESSGIRDALLHPAVAELPTNPPPLPSLLTQSFSEHIACRFNTSQAMAIHWGVHCAVEEESQLKSQSPITLIQGPPGTGKTTSVMALLNTIHLTLYLKHASSKLYALEPRNTASSEGKTDPSPQASKPKTNDANRLSAMMNSMSHTFKDVKKRTISRPRLLVCAPSNAAVDELLRRILQIGFLDGNIGRYNPNVVRVGMSEMFHPEVKAVSLEHMVEEQLKAHLRETKGLIRQLYKDLKNLEADISRISTELQLVNSDCQRLPRLEDLAKLNDIKVGLNTKKERCEITLRFLSGKIKDRKVAVDLLEESFLKEAEIVFTTLSSSGRQLFSKLPPFSVCIVDEAAQASELAALVPLQLGCRRVILVGDPEQLPATVLSKVAQDNMFEQSLFQRLRSAGHPVSLLNVQYRMHPEISEFPSRYFYKSQLVDGPDVGRAVPFHEDPLLGPYLFFDVPHGRESRGSTSYYNAAEVNVVVALYDRLRRGFGDHFNVGIVTPYRQQKYEIENEIKRRFGHGCHAYVNTVDSFQGQERDIIIFSCVRAQNDNHGIGFVSDNRRLNVALTRAKSALWIVGNVSSLKQNQTWKDLVDDAMQRGKFVSTADVSI